MIFLCPNIFFPGVYVVPTIVHFFRIFQAPTNVTCILKTLVESGEMILSDGRRIVPHNAKRIGGLEQKNLIKMHPDFR